VTAWAIDDFGHSPSVFTAAVTSEARSAGRAIQPTLEFYPVVYHDELSEAFAAKYATAMDALILPYRDDSWRNTVVTGTLRSQLDSAAAILGGHGRKLVLMVYAQRLTNTEVTPDVEYVRRITRVGMQYTRAGTIAGVVQFKWPWTPGQPGLDDSNFSHATGSGALVLAVNENTETTAGRLAEGYTTLRLLPGSGRCLVTLWHRDNRGPTPEKTGYHVKQVTVNGVVLWQKDVFTDDTAWHSIQLDVFPHLMPGASNILSLRLRELAGVTNLHVRVQFDDITLSGCVLEAGDRSFESVGGWTFDRLTGAVHSGQHIFDPVYSTSFANVVAAEYAG